MAFLALFSLAFFIWPQKPSTSEPQIVPYRNPELCKSLLNGNFGGGSSASSQEDLLHARALPNTRLYNAFGINNAFTTSDTSRYTTFVDEAKSLLKTGQWDQIRDVAIKLIKSYQRKYEADVEGILLAPFVGTRVLIVIFHVFFDASTKDVDESLAQLVAEDINNQWVLSKVKPLQYLRLRADQEVLRTRLNEILAKSHATLTSEFAKENPLNIILPAYETLWRVVLRCFIELQFRGVEGRDHARQVLAKFLATPTRTQFNIAIEDDRTIQHHATSAKWIIQEALRLYPPSRRIHRYVPASYPDQLNPHIGAADIEFLHRDKGFWGDDAMKFNQYRWKDITGDGDHFMPFGYGRFVCPAKPTFGPMMIAVLVASLLDGFGDGWILEGDVGRDEPLDLDRTSLKGLRVRRE